MTRPPCVGTAAPHDDRHALVVAEPGDRRHVLRRAGKHHEVGRAALLERVGAVPLQRRRVLKNERAAGDAGDP